MAPVALVAAAVLPEEDSPAMRNAIGPLALIQLTVQLVRPPRPAAVAGSRGRADATVGHAAGVPVCVCARACVRVCARAWTDEWMCACVHVCVRACVVRVCACASVGRRCVCVLRAYL